MIDGEPNATDDPGKARTGIRPENECLPEPLRYGVPCADGSILPFGSLLGFNRRFTKRNE